MKLKLDENFGLRAADLLVRAGHDAETVRQEGLGGSTDATIFAACVAERRCLVTLDLDFAHTLRFPPHQSAGIAVLRSAKSNTPAILQRLLQNLIDALTKESIGGRLWIVEVSKVRVHANTNPDADF